MFCSNVQAQKFIRLEKSGHLDSKQFALHTDLTYKLKAQPEDWYKGRIKDLFAEEAVILFEDRMIAIKDISHIKTYDGKVPSQATATGLYTFAAGWALYGGIAEIFDAYSWDSLDTKIVGAAAGLGAMTQTLFRSKTHRLGGRKQLRIIDLTVDAPQVPQSP